MTIKFYWRAENSVNLDATHDYSAGDTSAATNSSPSFSGTAAKYGSYGILIDSSTDRYDFNPASILSSSVSGSAGAVGMWFQYPTAIPGTALSSIFYVRGNASANDTIGILTHSGTGASNRNLTLNIRHVSG